jgi:hypothetical protein
MPLSFRGGCSVGAEHENVVFVFASISPASSRWIGRTIWRAYKASKVKFRSALLRWYAVNATVACGQSPSVNEPGLTAISPQPQILTAPAARARRLRLVRAFDLLDH